MYLLKTVLWSRRRLIAGMFVLGFVVFLIISPSASESFMALCLGGVVPGTSVVLPPEVMLWSIVILLVSFTTLSIIRRRIRSRHKRAAHQVQIPVIEEITEPAIYLPEKDVLVAVQAQVTARRPRVKRRHTYGIATVKRRAAGALHTYYNAVLKPSAQLIVRMLYAAGKNLGRILVILWKVIRAITILFGSLIVTISIAAGSAAARTWRWSLPYLRRFDTWLEMQYRRVEQKFAAKITSYDVVRASRDIAHDYTASVTRVRSRLKTPAQDDGRLGSAADVDDHIV